MHTDIWNIGSNNEHSGLIAVSRKPFFDGLSYFKGEGGHMTWIPPQTPQGIFNPLVIQIKSPVYYENVDNGEQIDPY